MAHEHSVYDTDPHYKIDPLTRAIIDQSETPTKLMQHDHNSERFTFEIDRLIDGHDMTLCNKVEVHFLNVDASTKVSKADVYTVEDIGISPASDDVVIFSWLVSQSATQYAGTLNFRIRFVCTDEDAKVVYAWHTDIFKGISVSNGINNSEVGNEEYWDVLEQWKNEIFPENPSYSSHQMFVAAPIGFKDADGNEVKVHLKRLNSGKGSVGIVTKYNRDKKLAEGLITEDEYENTIDRDELTEWSIPVRTRGGQIIAEDGTEPFSVVNKRQLDAVKVDLQTKINNKVSKLNSKKTYPLVYADLGYDSSGNHLGEGYLICSEGNSTKGILEAQYGQLPRFSKTGTLKSNDPTSDFEVVNKRTLDNALANFGGGGSAKLYLHRVSITIIFPEEEWMDNPYGSFLVGVYRTNDTPIESLADLTDVELTNFRTENFVLYDAPEANRVAVRLYKRSATANWLVIEYLDGIDDYQGVMTGAVDIHKDNLSITDTITEV